MIPICPKCMWILPTGSDCQRCAPPTYTFDQSIPVIFPADGVYTLVGGGTATVLNGTAYMNPVDPFPQENAPPEADEPVIVE